MLSFILLLAVGISILKICEDSSRKREQGRLVASIVSEQLKRLQNATEVRTAQEDDLLSLRRWLIANELKLAKNPSAIAEHIDEVSQSEKMSATEHGTLQRWKRVLNRWAVSKNNDDEKQLLRDGRRYYYEATGFVKTGHPYDATVLDLWVISTLTRFVEKTPLSPNIPEALFMLGDAYVNLGHSVPAQIKRDRILCLCSEFYPASVWAKRADSIWKEEFSVNAI
jgi:TolA-binding protein